MILMTSSAEYAPACLSGFSNSESTESASESWSPFQAVSMVMESSSDSSDPKSKTLLAGGEGILVGSWVEISGIKSLTN